MITLVAIANILFIAFGSASFANLLDDCFQPGMILSKWGDFVRGKRWAKPIGGCLKCTNIWVTFLMVVLFFFIQPVAVALMILGISNTVLNYVAK